MSRNLESDVPVNLDCTVYTSFKCIGAPGESAKKSTIPSIIENQLNIDKIFPIEMFEMLN